MMRNCNEYRVCGCVCVCVIYCVCNDVCAHPSLERERCVYYTYIDRQSQP